MKKGLLYKMNDVTCDEQTTIMRYIRKRSYAKSTTYYFKHVCGPKIEKQTKSGMIAISDIDTSAFYQLPGQLSVEDKLRSCYSNVNARSAAKMCGVSYHIASALYRKMSQE